MAILQDLRYGFRGLGRSRLHSSIAIATLAVGIGATSAMFSVLHAVLLLRPPYQEPDRLVSLRQKFPQIGEAWLSTSPSEFTDYRDRARAFQGLAGYEHATFDLTGGSEPVRVEAERVTFPLFSLLGVSPAAG